MPRERDLAFDSDSDEMEEGQDVEDGDLPESDEDRPQVHGRSQALHAAHSARSLGCVALSAIDRAQDRPPVHGAVA